MKSHMAALAAATVGFCAHVAAAAEYESAPLTVADTAEPTPQPSAKQERPVRVGVYGSAGFPSPLSVGAMLMFERRFSIGAEYGFLPASQLFGVDVTYRSISADARWYPFRDGPLYLGLRAGRQSFSASKTVTVSAYGQSGTFTGSTSSDSWYLNPRIGLFKMWDSGIFVGADVGVKIPVSHRESESLPYGVAMPDSVVTARDAMSTKVIPTVTLLQLGVSF